MTDVPTEYHMGREAKNDGQERTACPHGLSSSGRDPTVTRRENSQACKRHWWLAGWHDKDIELGNSVIREASP